MRMAALRPHDDGVLGREPVGPVVGSEHRRETVEHPVRTGPPGGREDLTGAGTGLDPDRRRPGRCQRRAPDRTIGVQLERRVPRPAPQRPQDHGGRAGAISCPCPDRRRVPLGDVTPLHQSSLRYEDAVAKHDHADCPSRLSKPTVLPGRHNGGVLLADLAEVSAVVRATRSRTAKSAAIAGALRAADPAEIETVVAYLSGELRQRRTGWAGRCCRPWPTAPIGRR